MNAVLNISVAAASSIEQLARFWVGHYRQFTHGIKPPKLAQCYMAVKEARELAVKQSICLIYM